MGHPATYESSPGPEAAPARLPVTLCISTRNAEGSLADALASAADWVSEIIVVDMESSDRTREVARSFGARIIDVPNAGFAEPGRQAGIDAASQPWVLVLDADERAGPGVRDLVASYVSRGDVAGVRLPRQNYLFGRWIRHSYWPDWSLRLFRADATKWPPRVHTPPEVDGRIERAPATLDVAISHQSVGSIREWIDKANHYTDFEVDRYIALGRSASLTRVLLYPAYRFLDYYVYRGGYRDGWRGLTLALLWAYYFAIVELKLRERTH